MLHTTKLVLVRHGASRSTEIEIVGGHSGCRGLSVEGVLQSERLSRRWLRNPPFDRDLAFGGAYCSSMRRAQDTAAIVLSTLELSLTGSSCDLCEIHPGVADGMSWTDVAEKFGQIDVFADPDKSIAPGAESWNQMRDRVMRFLSLLAEKHRDETVLVFAHKGVIDATVATWLNGSPRVLGAGTGNTGITTWLVRTDGRGAIDPALISYNDCGHLEQA